MGEEELVAAQVERDKRNRRTESKKQEEGTEPDGSSSSSNSFSSNPSALFFFPFKIETAFVSFLFLVTQNTTTKLWGSFQRYSIGLEASSSRRRWSCPSLAYRMLERRLWST